MGVNPGWFFIGLERSEFPLFQQRFDDALRHSLPESGSHSILEQWRADPTSIEPNDLHEAFYLGYCELIVCELLLGEGPFEMTDRRLLELTIMSRVAPPLVLRPATRSAAALEPAARTQKTSRPTTKGCRAATFVRRQGAAIRRPRPLAIRRRRPRPRLRPLR